MQNCIALQHNMQFLSSTPHYDNRDTFLHAAYCRLEGVTRERVDIEVYTGKGACPHIGRSLRVATRSNPLVARSTALLFSRRCLRCSPSYRDLKFAPFQW